MPDISVALRRLVHQRAEDRCEYCRLPQQFAPYLHEPDHIVPIQHGGETVEDNLALACCDCNRYKGPNVGSFDTVTGKLTPFFHPRHHRWSEHFAWKGYIIHPLTAEGRVTAHILRFNDDAKVEERHQLGMLGYFPK